MDRLETPAAINPIEPGAETYPAPLAVPLQGAVELSPPSSPEGQADPRPTEPKPEEPVRRRARLIELSIDYPEQMDTRSFGEIYRAYFPVLVRYVQHNMGNCNFGALDAETIVQDTFLKLHAFEFERGRHLDAHGQLQSWLYRTATTTALDVARRESHSQATDPDALLELMDSHQPPVEFGSLIDDRSRLELLNELEPQKRYYLWMQYVEGWPLADIAEKTGRPEGTIKAAIHRAKVELKAKLRSAAEAEKRDPSDV